MTPWLVITLAAPLASFGERAGNVERSTADRPSRSALIGLAGAALGVRRDDMQGQRQLTLGLRTATATFLPGTMASDFHTYQSLPSTSKPAPRTRTEALARKSDLNTSITRREYRADIWHEAAYALERDARWTLEELAAAFRSPRFVLFMGRKSCPLGAPLDPQIVDAEDIADLFSLRYRHEVGRGLAGPALHRRTGRVTVAAERRADLGDRLAGRHRRNDEPGDRRAWHFSARHEFVATIVLEEDPT